MSLHTESQGKEHIMIKLIQPLKWGEWSPGSQEALTLSPTNMQWVRTKISSPSGVVELAHAYSDWLCRRYGLTYRKFVSCCYCGLLLRTKFSSLQSLSHVWLFATPWTAARQASLSITNSQSPPKPMSMELVMPSSHLILCRPLLLLPPIPPSIRVLSFA